MARKSLIGQATVILQGTNHDVAPSEDNMFNLKDFTHVDKYHGKQCEDIEAAWSRLKQWSNNAGREKFGKPA